MSYNCTSGQLCFSSLEIKLFTIFKQSQRFTKKNNSVIA